MGKSASRNIRLDQSDASAYYDVCYVCANVMFGIWQLNAPTQTMRALNLSGQRHIRRDVDCIVY